MVRYFSTQLVLSYLSHPAKQKDTKRGKRIEDSAFPDAATGEAQHLRMLISSSSRKKAYRHNLAKIVKMPDMPIQRKLMNLSWAGIVKALSFVNFCKEQKMSVQILVAYASGSSSTREVAEAIAAEIAGGGLQPIVQNVSQVDSVAQYGGVVMGSSIRIGRWLPEAVACLERIKDQLAEKPVAYFTTCLAMVDDTKESRKTVLEYMQPLFQLTPDVKPVGLGLFAGSLDPERRSIMVGDGPQGDFRDWDAIHAWAREIRKVFIARQEDTSLDLTETILSYTDMSHSDLSRVDLQGSELYGSNLAQTNMEASKLAWADLSQSHMEGANLFQANLIGTIMTGAVLNKANLAEATLNGAILQNASLVGADLRRADLNWVDFSRADLRQAQLQQARLGWAKLTGAQLEGANLTGTWYNEHTIWPEGFSPEEAGCINAGRGAI